MKKTLLLGKIEGRKRRLHQRMRWLADITDSMVMSLSKLREILKDREAWNIAVYGDTKRVLCVVLSRRVPGSDLSSKGSRWLLY